MPPVLSRGCPQLGGMQVNSFFLTFMVPYSHFFFHMLYMSRRSCHLLHYRSLKTLSHSKWEPLRTYTLQICVHALIHTHYLLEQNGTQFAAVQASEGPVDKPQRHHLPFSLLHAQWTTMLQCSEPCAPGQVAKLVLWQISRRRHMPWGCRDVPATRILTNRWPWNS